jgi:hypothetical protein
MTGDVEEEKSEIALSISLKSTITSGPVGD